MDIKVSETEMHETIQISETKTIVHDLKDLIKRRADAQAQADTYSAIVKDFDTLIKRMETVGCKVEVTSGEVIVDGTEGSGIRPDSPEGNESDPATGG